MNKSSNTHKHEPPSLSGAEPFRKATCVFRRLKALLSFETSPLIHSEKLLIIFANIRV